MSTTAASRWGLAALAAAMVAAAGVGAGEADATCSSSVPVAASFADEPFDGEIGLAPEVASVDVSLGAVCELAVTRGSPTALRPPGSYATRRSRRTSTPTRTLPRALLSGAAPTAPCSSSARTDPTFRPRWGPGPAASSASAPLPSCPRLVPPGSRRRSISSPCPARRRSGSAWPRTGRRLCSRAGHALLRLRRDLRRRACRPAAGRRTTGATATRHDRPGSAGLHGPERPPPRRDLGPPQTQPRRLPLASRQGSQPGQGGSCRVDVPHGRYANPAHGGRPRLHGQHVAAYARWPVRALHTPPWPGAPRPQQPHARQPRFLAKGTARVARAAVVAAVVALKGSARLRDHQRARQSLQGAARRTTERACVPAAVANSLLPPSESDDHRAVERGTSGRPVARERRWVCGTVRRRRFRLVAGALPRLACAAPSVASMSRD
jgi:hypothetical protein